MRWTAAALGVLGMLLALFLHTTLFWLQVEVGVGSSAASPAPVWPAVAVVSVAIAGLAGAVVALWKPRIAAALMSAVSLVIIGHALIYMALPSGHGLTTAGRVFVLLPSLLLFSGAAVASRARNPVNRGGGQGVTV